MNVGSAVDILEVYDARVFRVQVLRAVTFKAHTGFRLERTTGNGEGAVLIPHLGQEAQWTWTPVKVKRQFL
jgi:hypothetical protein